MTTTTFSEYIKEIFYPFLKTNDIPFPVIVFIDGHSSYLAFETQDFCRNKGIWLVPLYPNTTHILQPMDVSCFKPLKYNWREAVHEWKATTKEPSLSKESFCDLFTKVVTDTMKPHLFKSGFECCGLHPWNPERINYNKFVRQKDDVEEPQVPQKPTEKEEYEIIKRAINRHIGPEKLNNFCNHFAMNKGVEWNGDRNDTNLYAFWKQIIEKCNCMDVPDVQAALIENAPVEQFDDEIFNDNHLQDWLGNDKIKGE